MILAILTKLIQKNTPFAATFKIKCPSFYIHTVCVVGCGSSGAVCLQHHLCCDLPVWFVLLACQSERRGGSVHKEQSKTLDIINLLSIKAWKASEDCVHTFNFLSR